jgi:hypothetical protein
VICLSKNKDKATGGLQKKQVNIEEKERKPGYGDKKLEGPNRPST